MILLAQMLLDPVAMGMGNAYTALASSPYAVYYNPAILPDLSGKVIVASSTRILAYNSDSGTAFSNLGTSVFVAVPSLKPFMKNLKGNQQDVALGIGFLGTCSSFASKQLFLSAGLKSKVSKLGLHVNLLFDGGKIYPSGGAAVVVPIGGYYTAGARIYYNGATSWIDNAFSVRYTREEFGLTVVAEASLLKGVNNIDGYIPGIYETQGKSYYYAVKFNFGLEKRLNSRFLIRIGSYDFKPTIGVTYDLPYLQLTYAYVDSITVQHSFGIKVSF